MPLPKDLPRGARKSAKKKRVGAVLHELKGGPHHKDRTRAQEIAIAMKSSGQSRKKRMKSRRRR